MTFKTQTVHLSPHPYHQPQLGEILSTVSEDIMLAGCMAECAARAQKHALKDGQSENIMPLIHPSVSGGGINTEITVKINGSSKLQLT